MQLIALCASLVASVIGATWYLAGQINDLKISFGAVKTATEAHARKIKKISRRIARLEGPKS